MADGPAERADGVMLLAPAPFVTVTIEEADEIHVHPGGQGVWQARMLVSLGVRVVFCTALGGELARILRPLLTDGALNVTRHGPGTGNAETVAALVDHVLVEPWKEAE